MAVNLGDGIPKALRCWLEHIEKHPPLPNAPIAGFVAPAIHITQDEPAL